MNSQFFNDNISGRNKYEILWIQLLLATTEWQIYAMSTTFLHEQAEMKQVSMT